MNYLLKRNILLATMFTFNIINAHATPSEEESAYCVSNAGVVHEMTVQYMTNHGLVYGFSDDFCQFRVDSGIIEVGLSTYASAASNIAATYMKTLPTIEDDSPLWRGTSSNPSHNVCKNLGGSMVVFAQNGNFTGTDGQSDICMFGDGSMVSAWSLIYMANHRTGYDAIKNSVRSEPL